MGYITKSLTRYLLWIVIINALSCTSKKDRSIKQDSQDMIKNEVTIKEIRSGLQQGQYSIVELTQYYLDRIDDMNKKGPQLNAVITINPDALAIAKQLDKEFQSKNIRGPLHGIPVLLKDNINTGDKMPCTAGAIPMRESFPSEDSPLAAQLRKAGAVILGKANMSEWANFHSDESSSGWSALGGQAKNPYRLDYNPCGSSSGSGIAVAANLCVIAIGTETNGSIICPSTHNGIVGIKPTVGLISRTGIIPISDYQDTGGPMARTVEDAVIALGTMTDKDEEDHRTLESGRKAHQDYTSFLKKDGIRGKRIGYYSAPLKEDNTALTDLMNEALNHLKEHEAEIIEIDSIIPEDIESRSYVVMKYEFKEGLNAYLKKLGDRATVENLEEIIDITFADEVEMKYHDHKILTAAQAKGNLESKEYLEALAYIKEASRANGIDRVMDEHKLDAIVAPSGSPAWKTDLENGDTFGVFSSSPAAIAGYPSITVPMGKIDDLPVGMSIFGRAWSEPILIEIAYSYERGTQHRYSPTYLTD